MHVGVEWSYNLSAWTKIRFTFQTTKKKLSKYKWGAVYFLWKYTNMVLIVFLILLALLLPGSYTGFVKCSKFFREYLSLIPQEKVSAELFIFMVSICRKACVMVKMMAFCSFNIIYGFLTTRESLRT